MKTITARDAKTRFGELLDSMQREPVVITKNNRDSEMDIAAVQAQARALNGSRVRATGMWSTYVRDGRRIPYMIVTRLDPA